MHRKQIIEKTSKLLYTNYADIVFTKTGNQVVYALLSIGLRIHFTSKDAKVTYKGKIIAESANKEEYGYLFRSCIDCTNKKETEDFQNKLKQFNQLEDKVYETDSNDFYEYLNDNTIDRMFND